MSIHLKIKGIPGESSDSNHKGWIDVDDIEWGVARRITSDTSTQSDRESANAEITELEVMRRMDAASPYLFLEACCGRGQPMELHLTKTGTGSGTDVFMSYILGNAVVSKYEVLASALGRNRPLERLLISFVDLEVKYTPYDESGEPLPSIAVGFDTATNQKH